MGGVVESSQPQALRTATPTIQGFYFSMGENLKTDLFGDPIVEPQEGRGRPEHSWSLANSNKVLLAFACGRTVKEAAVAIGVSVPTLRKHYFAEVSKRESAAIRFEMTQLARLNALAESGKASADRELARMMERIALRLRPSVPVKAKKPKPLGKKDEQRSAAYEAHKGTSWGDLLPN